MAVAGPMPALLKSDAEFIWDQPQTDALEKMKQAITQQLILGYADPSKPVTLECNSSQYGTGAALQQDGRPVAFVSKILTSMEKGYAQKQNVEKEMLAICLGCKHFHQYIYGRPVIVHTDHRRIASIICKTPFSKAPRFKQHAFAVAKV